MAKQKVKGHTRGRKRIKGYSRKKRKRKKKVVGKYRRTCTYDYYVNANGELVKKKLIKCRK